MRCIVLLVLFTMPTAAWAADEPVGPRPVSAHAEATVTIIRGESISAVPMRRKGLRAATGSTEAERQYRAMPDRGVRVDFY